MKKRFCDNCEKNIPHDAIYYDIMISSKKSDPEDDDKNVDSINCVSGFFCEACIISGRAVTKHLAKWLFEKEEKAE